MNNWKLLTMQDRHNAFGRPKGILYPEGVIIPSDNLEFSIKMAFFREGGVPIYLPKPIEK
jgi:hypothetical protein